MIMKGHQQGRFYRLSTGRATDYENLKHQVPSPEDWLEHGRTRLSTGGASM